MTVDSTWTQLHKSISSGNVNAVMGCFSSNTPSIVCVPTGGGADGSHSALSSFVKQLVAQRQNAHFEESILCSVTAHRQLVQESLVTLVHDDPIDWLLPGVKPTKKRIVLPLVSIVHFDETGKIQTWHLHWDQGTVLRQVGVLPNSLYCKSNASEVVLPVQGPRVADRLREPYNNVVSLGARVVDTEYALEEDQQEVVQQTIRKPTSSENIFGNGQDAPFPTTTAARQQSEMGDILSGNVQPADPVTGARPSSRVIHRPGGPSSNIFNSEPMDQIKTGKSFHPQRATTLFGGPELESTAPTTQQRRSVAPFETDDDMSQQAPVVRKSNRRDPNWSSLSEPAVPAALSFDDAPLPNAAGRKNSYHTHNASQWDMGGNNNAAPMKSTGKGAYHNPNETQHEMADRKALEHVNNGGNYEAPPQQQRFGRKMSAHAQDSNDLFGAATAPASVTSGGAVSGLVGVATNMRDRNALSEPAAERPSSKVLAPPGGKTSVFFG